MVVLTNRATVDYNFNDFELSTFSAVAFERRTNNMPCQLYCNNGYACGGCVHFVKSTAVTLTGSNLAITIPNQVLTNHEKICLCIAQAIPAGVTADTTVSISVNGTTVEMMTTCGNHVYADQIRSRKVYPLNIATDTPAAVVTSNNKLCRTAHVFPSINIPAPAVESF